MAFVLTSKYDPFTIEEAFKVPELYGKAYRETEEAYDAVATAGADAISGLDPNSEAYKRVKEYNDAVDSYIDDFSKGMNYKNRAALNKARRNYARDIIPVTKAKEELNEINKRRDALLAKDSSIKFYDTPTVDGILSGNQYSNSYVSGKEVATKVAAKAEALARAKYSNNPQFTTELGGQKFRMTNPNGYSYEELMSALASTSDNEIKKILNDELEASGANNLSSEDRRMIEQEAITGLYAGLAKPTQQLINNENYINAYQAAHLGMQQQEFNFKMQQAKKAEGMAEGIVPISVNPDGTRIFQNRAGYTYTDSPKKIMVTEKNREEIAKSRGVPVDRIPLGRSYYLYEDKNGGKYYGSSVYGYKTPDGEDASLVYNPPSVPITNFGSKKEEKEDNSLGYILSINIGNSTNPQVVENSALQETRDFQYLVPVTRKYDGLGSNVQSWIAGNVSNVDRARNKFNYFLAYLDENGDELEPKDRHKAAEVRLVISDK